MSVCADLFKKNLESKNLRFSSNVMENGDDVVSFPYSGKEVRMFFSGDNGEYLSLYLVYENVPEDRIADAIFICNELNCKYKWVTYYVDGDRDVIIHDDAILSADTAADEAFELLARMVKISDEAKPVLMKAIYG